MDIGKSKKLRESQKKYTEKLIEKIRKSCEEFNGSLQQREILTGLKKSLEEKSTAIQRLDEAILESAKEKDYDKEIESSGEFSEAVFSCLAKIETCLHTRQSSSDQSPQDTKSAPKLPKLTLKTFDGDPANWQSFWDCYNTSVYESKLSDIDKFNYLKGCLSGQAAKSIEGIPLTEKNLKTAVDILKDRFAQPQVLISSYMNNLLHINKVENVENTSKLRTLYDQLEINIRNLTAMGVESDTYGTLLIPIIMDKIPNEISLEINRKLDKKDSLNANKVLAMIKAEVEARERCSTSRAQSELKNESSESDKHQGYRRRPQFNATSSTLQTSDRNIVYCTFCSKNHPSIRCDIVTDPASRKDVLKRKGRCFICLRSGHLSSKCKSQHNCHKCQGRHHTSICNSQSGTSSNKVMSNTRTENPLPNTAFSSQLQPPNMFYKESSSSSQPAKTTGLFVGNDNAVLLQTARACVRNPSSRCTANVRMIFDSGSQRSYISNPLRSILALPTVSASTILIKTFGEETSEPKKCDQVQFAVKTLDGTEVYVSAYTTPLICSPLANQAIDVAVNTYEHIKDLKLADSCDGNEDLTIDILIGADHYWQFTNGDVRIGKSGPVAMKTKLGWILSGPTTCKSECIEGEDNVNLISTHVLKVETSTLNQIQVDRHPHPSCAQFWDMEMIGTCAREENKQDDKELSIDTEFNDGIYQVKLPFIAEHSTIPDNYSTSFKRLHSLHKRLQKNPDILKQYDEVIKDQMEKGVVERVTDSSIVEVGKVHYLPHREVIRTDRSTTKLRVVYDASSKGPQNVGPSLNECLHTGESLNPLLVDILLRFRTHRIALTADIEKAFLNISISPEHRDYLRFLWINNIDDDNPNIEVYRFTRLVFGLTSSPYILNATIRHHLNQYVDHDPEFVTEVINSLYVDDYTSGSDDVQTAAKLASKVKQRMQSGGFNMRKFMSNSKELNTELHNNELFHDSCVNPVDVTEYQMLGLTWNTDTDTFVMKLDKVTEELAKTTSITKRVVLSTAAKFYDPLGFISPVVLQMKILFQEMCKRKLDWDEPLPEDMIKNFNSIISDLNKTCAITLNRCCIDPSISREEIKSTQLHAFGDASERAYGSVVYVRVEYTSKICCYLVASKTRIAPQNEQTIPRLELQAAVVTARLAMHTKEVIQEVLPIDEVILWSDSSVVLHWIINGAKKQKQYVQNRIKELNELTQPMQWRYCPSLENPADIASRGVLASQLINNDKWFKGPQFLSKPPESWPSQDVITKHKRQIEEIIKFETVESTSVNINIVKKSEVQPEAVIPISNYSDFQHILRVTAYVLRFIANLRRKKSKQPLVVESLSVQELNNAEKSWIRTMQYSIKLSPDKTKQLTTSLNLFMDEDDIIRCKGRLKNASVPYDTRNPILLPSDHYLTELIIRNCHDNVMHNGVKETLAEVRKKFWIIRGRQVVKKHLSKCVTCKRIQGQPYRATVPPPLPSFRLSDDYAFTRIGIDFAGPVYVKDIYRDGQSNKAYIVLYTCASSRAVHLDLVPDLSADSFIRSLKRFFGRRGIPVFILSDNGKTFKDKKLKKFVLSKNIEWKYNVERAPWWGGFFERLVRSIKRPLRKQLNNARLNYEEFLTILIEVEGVLNSRPLTYVYDEIDEILTPSHLVLGRRLMTQPGKSHIYSDDCVVDTPKELNKRSCYLQKILDTFWLRWQKEYLTELREHYHYKNISNQPSAAKEGDIVTIYKDKLPRQSWKMGRIVKLLKGRDGIDRAAIVKTTTKEGKPSQLRRPLTRLYPIEVQAKKIEEDVQHIEQLPVKFVDESKIDIVNTC